MKNLLLIAFVLLSFAVSAQSNPREHISSFNMTSFTYKHNEKWQAYVELQARGIEDYSKIDYYEIKGGIGYNIAKGHQPFIGIGRYGTYRDSRIYQEEFRIWLQYIFSHSLSRIKLDHRVRAEKRFFDYPQSNTESSTERYRYRLTATVPLNTKKIQPGSFFINGFDELFFGPELPTFKRNRVFGGVGYVFNDNLSTNLGYMWQREFSLKSNRNLHFLYFALNFTIDRQEEKLHHGVPVAD